MTARASELSRVDQRFETAKTAETSMKVNSSPSINGPCSKSSTNGVTTISNSSEIRNSTADHLESTTNRRRRFTVACVGPESGALLSITILQPEPKLTLLPSPLAGEGSGGRGDGGGERPFLTPSPIHMSRPIRFMLFFTPKGARFDSPGRSAAQAWDP